MITINNELQRVHKAQTIIAGSFLTMGLTAFFSTPLPEILPLVSATLSIPLIIMSLRTHFHLKQNEGLALNSNIFRTSYKKKFNNWLIDYLEKSENDTEVKYKMIFTSMWMYSKKLTKHDLFDKKDNFLEEIADRVIKNKETNIDIFSLFLNNNNNKDLVMKLFEEDQTTTKKTLIAKKVYKDFEDLGLVGKHFMYWSATEMLCLIPLQKYKLNNQDIKEIKEITKKNLKTPNPFNHSLLFTELSMNYCVKIINENIEHLPVLKAFFASVGQDSKIKNISTLIEKTINSYEIFSRLETSLTVKKEIFKVNKL